MLKRLEELQSFEKVIAPFDGVITQRLVNEGDLINRANGGTGAQLFHSFEDQYDACVHPGTGGVRQRDCTWAQGRADVDRNCRNQVRGHR